MWLFKWIYFILIFDYIIIIKDISKNKKEMENKIDEELKFKDEFIDDFEDNN